MLATSTGSRPIRQQRSRNAVISVADSFKQETITSSTWQRIRRDIAGSGDAEFLSTGAEVYRSSTERAKLQQLHAAGDLKDLSIPASNQLEPLKGNRKGEYSIRINK